MQGSEPIKFRICGLITETALLCSDAVTEDFNVLYEMS